MSPERFPRTEATIESQQALLLSVRENQSHNLDQAGLIKKFDQRILQLGLVNDPESTSLDSDDALQQDVSDHEDSELGNPRSSKYQVCQPYTHEGKKYYEVRYDQGNGKYSRMTIGKSDITPEGEETRTAPTTGFNESDVKVIRVMAREIEWMRESGQLPDFDFQSMTFLKSHPEAPKQAESHAQPPQKKPEKIIKPAEVVTTLGDQRKLLGKTQEEQSQQLWELGLIDKVSQKLWSADLKHIQAKLERTIKKPPSDLDPKTARAFMLQQERRLQPKNYTVCPPHFVNNTAEYSISYDMGNDHYAFVVVGKLVTEPKTGLVTNIIPADGFTKADIYRVRGMTRNIERLRIVGKLPNLAPDWWNVYGIYGQSVPRPTGEDKATAERRSAKATTPLTPPIETREISPQAWMSDPGIAKSKEKVEIKQDGHKIRLQAKRLGRMALQYSNSLLDLASNASTNSKTEAKRQPKISRAAIWGKRIGQRLLEYGFSDDDVLANEGAKIQHHMDMASGFSQETIADQKSVMRRSSSRRKYGGARQRAQRR